MPFIYLVRMDNINETHEERIFRLETQMATIQHDLGEVKDRTKNAHHRIDETNNSIEKLREEMKKGFDRFVKMFQTLNENLAQKDAEDKKWRKVLIIVGVVAIFAFVGQFIQDASLKSTVGDIALKVGAGVAATI